MQSTKKERIGWYFYDWANSAFYTTVVTVFLGPYLTTIANAAADVSGFIYPLGIPVRAGSFFPYVVSFSVLLQVIFLPIFGAIADYSNRKKTLLGIFAYIGAFATMFMYFLEGNGYLFGGLLFIIANLSFGISIVMYNSFLNEIAAPEKRDAVSSVGWGIGYLGGGILLALNLVLYSQTDSLGIDAGFAVRISLCSAGAWWALFTIFPMISLKVRQPIRILPAGKSYLSFGFSQFISTLKEARKYPNTILFLLAFLFYNDGVQTIIVVSSQFGQEELGLSISTLTTVILMVQFVAFFGAMLFNFVAKITDARRAILYSIVIWTAVLFYAYFFLRTETDFYILAAFIGLVLGGTQALSRSLYSKLIPEGKEAEYFSVYEISEKGTSWIGPLVFGLALQLTDSYRIAIFSLVIFFVFGFILLLKVNVKKGREMIAESNKSTKNQ
jgi:UMF1 family MFS transporter